MESTVTLGLDLGTTGVRVVAVDASSQLVAESTRSYPLLTPQPGWTEQSPRDWVRASLEALREVAGRLESPVSALGLSVQMHGLAPLDARGEVIRPAILWNDQRTGEAVREIEATVPREVLIGCTGNAAVTGFQLAKLLWLRRVEPESFSRLRHALLPKDYLGYALTGEQVTEPSDASGTNCFNLAEKDWDEKILSAVAVDVRLFPSVKVSSEIVGCLTAEAAEAAGLPAGLPVVAGAGDNAAAAIGLGLSSRTPGLGSLSLGTSGVIFAPLKAPTPDPQGRVHLFCHADGGYHLLGVTLAAAGSLQWYRDTFAPGQSFAEFSDLAGSSPPGANGVTFRPYLSGERTPHLNPDLRASFTGLSLATKPADMVRAVLEGVAFSLRDALDVITPLSPLERLLATGGGAKSPVWLQLLADVLQLPLEKTRWDQGAAYGAALLAMQGVGMVTEAAEATALEVTSCLTPGEFAPYREPLARYRDLPTKDG